MLRYKELDASLMKGDSDRLLRKKRVRLVG